MALKKKITDIAKTATTINGLVSVGVDASGDSVKIPVDAVLQPVLDAALSTKVDKEDGKGLSANDYSDNDKAKVDAIYTSSIKGCVAFYSESGNVVSISCAAPAWDNIIEYSLDRNAWTTWHGEQISGKVLYLRGYKNTHINPTTSSPYFRLSCATNDVHSEGYIWDLRDYTRSTHVRRAGGLYGQTFRENPCLKTALNLSEGDISRATYPFTNIYYGCENLEYVPPIEIDNITGCTLVFYNTFMNCNIKVLPEIKVSGNCDTVCYGMFQGNPLVKMSSTQTAEYSTPYKIPEVYGDRSFENMFLRTGGTFTWNPTPGQVLYTSNIVTRNTPVKLNQQGELDLDGLMYMPTVYAKLSAGQTLYNDDKVVYCPDFDLSARTDMQSFFQGCERLRRIGNLNLGTITGSCKAFFYVCYDLEHIDISSATITGAMDYAVHNCRSLKSFKVGSIDFANTTMPNWQVFRECYALTTIEGVFTNIKLDWDLSLSPLTAASAMVVINGLFDYSGDSGVHTLTLSTATKLQLTQEQMQVAYDKNWTIA